MITYPHAKVNLGLHVVGRRADGYHDIDTCFYPIPLSDVLEMMPAKEFSFTKTGLPLSGHPEDNLCVEAFKMLQERHTVDPVAIHLHKVIPPQAGLGGGSSDAAFVLKGLNDLFELQLSDADLSSFASELGSDCAFFLDHKPKRGIEKGDVLESCDVNLSGMSLLLVKPPVSVETVDAYSKVVAKQPKRSIPEVLKLPIDQWHDALINDFEAIVFEEFSTIETIKKQLYALGAIYASLTGSGSAVYGLFDQPVKVTKQFRGCSYWNLPL